jgi:hypothetical protein
MVRLYDVYLTGPLFQESSGMSALQTPSTSDAWQETSRNGQRRSFRDMKSEEEQQQELFQKVAEQVLIRSAFATDAYVAIVTTIGAVVTPLYVVTLRLVFDRGPLKWLSWDALPAWLLLSSVLLISVIRFPRRTFFDTKQPVQIFIAQQERTYRLRLLSATAVLLAFAGLISAVVALAQAKPPLKQGSQTSRAYPK